MPLSDGPQDKVRRDMRGEKEVSDPHRTRIAAKNRLPVRLPKKTKGGKGTLQLMFKKKKKSIQQTNKPVQT